MNWELFYNRLHIFSCKLIGTVTSDTFLRCAILFIFTISLHLFIASHLMWSLRLVCSDWNTNLLDSISLTLPTQWRPLVLTRNIRQGMQSALFPRDREDITLFITKTPMKQQNLPVSEMSKQGYFFLSNNANFILKLL